MNLEKERELFKQAYFNLRSRNSLPSPGAVFDEYIRLRDSEGYKLVPVDKLMDCLSEISDRSYIDDNVSEIKAMIGAAP